MRWMWCAACAACTACGRLGFSQTDAIADVSDSVADVSLPVLAPVQTTIGSQDMLPTALSIHPALTGSGHSLVIIAAIDTASQNLSGVFDDAGNTWQRILDGSDAGLTGRIEIWFVARANPVTDVSLTFTTGLERALAVQLTEWSGLSDQSPVVGFNLPPAAMSNTPTTGVASVAAPSLLLGATAIGGTPITTSLTTAGGVMLTPFGHTNITGAAAYRVVSPDDYELAWMLGESRYHTAGIIALRLE